jgi:hypothetical protein
VLVLNLLASTQDIATDGLAVTILGPEERGLGNGVQVAAYRIGMVIGGGVLVAVFDQSGWRTTFAAMAAILAGMGRAWWCAAGDANLWSSEVWSRHNSQHLVDPYSFTHVTHGVLLYGVLHLVAPGAAVATRAVLALALESGWEVLENSGPIIERYRAATISLGYYGDSVVNSISDILACFAGFMLAARLPAWGTVFAAVGLEAALVLWIRDSLLLNLLMLVHPLEALKRWQLGG